MATKAEYQDMARRAAREYDIPESLFMGLVKQESNWNPKAKSSAGAYGLTQFMPDTAADPGFGVRGIYGDQIEDPMSQLRFGARYFRAMLNRYGGDVDKTLAAYNWGAGNADKWSGDPNKLPGETKGYLTKVKGYADDYGGGYQEDATAQVGEDIVAAGSPSMAGAMGYGQAPVDQYGYGYEEGFDPATSRTSENYDPNAPKGNFGLGDAVKLGAALSSGNLGYALGVGAVALGDNLVNRGGKEGEATPADKPAVDFTQPYERDVYTGGEMMRNAGSGFLAGGPVGALAGLAGGWLSNSLSNRMDRREYEKAQEAAKEKEEKVGLGFSDVNATAAGTGPGGVVQGVPDRATGTSGPLQVAGISTSNYSGGGGSGTPGASGSDHWGSRPGLDFGDIGDAFGAAKDWISNAFSGNAGAGVTQAGLTNGDWNDRGEKGLSPGDLVG